MSTDIEKLKLELKEALEKISSLESEISVYKRHQNITKDGKPKKKPGPKKNSTLQKDKDVYEFEIFDLTISEKDHIVLSVGESKEYCDFGFIINHNQGKYCKFDNNNLYRMKLFSVYHIA